MKKSLITIAAAAAMVAPAIAMADATLYGNIHLSINDFDSKENVDINSHTSAIGVKGSEDLGDGVKAIYKMEFQLDPAEGGFNGGATGDALTQRDVFVGLKGGMGTVKIGTFSSNYKQLGGKNDSLYRTPVEGRGFIHTQSRLHNGRAINRGRMTNALSYTSPKMGGIQLVLNTTLSNNEEETVGAGLRWSNKNILAYVDWIDAQPGTAVALVGAPTESATKIGAKYKTKAYHVGLQYEDAEDLTGFNYIHFNAGYNINKNNSIQLTLGTAEHITSTASDTESFAVAYNHKLSKMTNVYVAYGDRSSDTVSNEDDAIAFGIKKKF